MHISTAIVILWVIFISSQPAHFGPFSMLSQIIVSQSLFSLLFKYSHHWWTFHTLLRNISLRRQRSASGRRNHGRASEKPVTMPNFIGSVLRLSEWTLSVCVIIHFIPDCCSFQSRSEHHTTVLQSHLPDKSTKRYHDNSYPSFLINYLQYSFPFSQRLQI